MSNAEEHSGLRSSVAAGSGPGWEPDEFLNPYAAEVFDVEQHATQILQAGNINEEVGRLGAALAELDTTIQTHVSQHYTDLLSRAVANSQLEQSLALMATHIDSLQLSSDRLRSRVAEPYGKIKQGTRSLERLQTTADILRRVIRILQLSKRLSGQMGAGGGDTDLAKAAAGLAELGELVEGDLTGLEVVEGEVRRMWAWRTEVERQADTLLARGMEVGNQAHIGTGLQVFYNLGTLPAVLTKLLDSCHNQLKRQATDTLDIKKISATADEASKTGASSGSSGLSSGKTGGGPGKATMPAPSNLAAFRATLWTHLDQVLEGVHMHMSRVLQLQRLLAKKHDPNTHLPYLSSLAQDGHDPCLVAMSWRKVTLILKDVLLGAAAKSNFIKQAFEGEYPKLVRLYHDLWNRLRLTAMQVSTAGIILDESLNLKDPFAGEEMCDMLRESLAQFEHAYLARSLSRLFDPVNLMFSGGGVPSREEVAGIFTTLASELSIAAVETRLSTAVVKNISKTIKLFCVKCEQAIKADSDASQVVGYPNDAQKHNVGIVNILADFEAGVNRLVEDHKSKNLAELLESANGIRTQMEGGLSPLLSSIEDAIEAIFLTAHKEDFSMEAEIKQGPCSLYMKELQSFLERISKDFLLHFTCKAFLDRQLQPLAERIIRLFVLHGALLRPIGAGGAMRLASDCAQLEFALSTILGPTGYSAAGPTGLNAIGPAYQLLRAFRALLFCKPEDMASYQGLGSVVDYSTMLHLLISRCPATMPSPQASLGWGLPRYTRWLEKHEERERLLLIQGTLEAYVAAARARQDKSYIHQYPILLDILQRGLQAVGSQ